MIETGTKTAYLFPGQGAQHVGMGAELAEEWPQIVELYNKANEIIGYDITSICFDGPEEKLNSTVYSQPAIFITSAALLEILKIEKPDLKPEITAGLSMGEYSALYAAGLISFEDGLKLVQKRGQAMQQAADSTSGSMVSILGLDEEKVMQLCDKASEGQVLVPVNFNCPGQIVISGDIEACKRAAEMAADFGAMKAVQLAVAGAFHTEMMKPAAEDLGNALTDCQIKDPSDIQVIANIDSEYYKNAEQIRDGLVKQLIQPILWQKCMEQMIADGVTQFIEIGPGRVLTGLMKRIKRKADMKTINSAETMQKVLQD